MAAFPLCPMKGRPPPGGYNKKGEDFDFDFGWNFGIVSVCHVIW